MGEAKLKGKTKEERAAYARRNRKPLPIRLLNGLVNIFTAWPVQWRVG